MTQLKKYFLLFAFVPLLSAAQVQVSARLDSTEILIGNRTKLILEAEISGENYVNFPKFAPLDTIIKGVEVVSVGELETSSYDGKMSQQLTITSFDAGKYILNFKFLVNNNTVQTADLPLTVRTLKVDVEKDELRDIKPVYDIPLSWQTILKYILILMGTILLSTLAGYFIWKKWRKKTVVMEENKEETPPVPPHITALRKLDEIKAEKLWENGRVKDFYIRLTDVLREYIEARFGINAPEMTSEEIIEAFGRNEELRMKNEEWANADTNSSFFILHSSFSETLRLADLVKFAKTKPSPGDNERSLANGYVFVEKTCYDR